MSELAIIINEEVGKSSYEMRKFFQKLVEEGILEAYTQRINKKTSEETEDEIITTIKKGVSLTPTQKLSSTEYSQFLKDPETGAEYYLFLFSHGGAFDSDGSHTTLHTCRLDKLIKEYDPRVLQKADRYAALIIPKEMVVARIKIDYTEEWDCSGPSHDICTDRRGSLTLNAKEGFTLEEEPLLQKVYDFVKGN